MPSINRQNIPNGLNIEKPEGDAFSQILSQIIWVADIEDLGLSSDLMEAMEPILDQDHDLEEDENILFNPINIPWILNRDISSETFEKGNIESIITPEGKVDPLLESNPAGHMDVLENINEENSIVFEQDLDALKETIEMGYKQLSIEESLEKYQPTSYTDKTIKMNKPIYSNMEDPKEDSFKSESIAMEEEPIPKAVSLNPKDEVKNIENDEIDLYKNPIQSLRVEKAYTNESNNEFNTSRNIDFNDNIQNVNDTIVDLMDLRTKGEDHTMKVKLYPEELGYIDVTLKMEEGKLVARILVENEQVRKLFNDHIHQLNNKLVEQEISLERVDVDLNLNTNSQSNSNNNQNSRQNQFPPNRGIILEKTTTITLNEENINGTDGLNILA